MKKFSDALPKDMDFEFLGELFKYELVHWTVAVEIADEAAQTNGKEPSVKDQIQAVIDSIPNFISDENDGKTRMKTLLQGKEKPVPIGQINDLYAWLLEVSSGRPTEQPSPSPSGRGRTVNT